MTPLSTHLAAGGVRLWRDNDAFTTWEPSDHRHPVPFIARPVADDERVRRVVEAAKALDARLVGTYAAHEPEAVALRSALTALGAP